MYTDQRQKDFFWGVLLGGTIAALSTALFNTKKGQQIQKQIGDVCEKVGENIKEVFVETKDKASELIEDAKTKVVESKNKLEDETEQMGKKIAHKAKKEE